MKPAEKAVLNRLVDLMIPLGLKFWVEKTEGGQPMMRLEPYVPLAMGSGLLLEVCMSGMKS